MALEDYRQGIMNIAILQADGQETDDMVEALAEAADQLPEMIQHEVSEILER